MYAGAGPGAMVAAAAAWDGIATELSSVAAGYHAVVSELTGGPWVGPSSMTMAAAVTPYMSWVNTTATQAELTASQLGSAVAAYEAAFAATVPPAEIEVNRALLAALVATNILGQNTPAIAATEALYAEMWAQDAMAMYGYAGASALATKLRWLIRTALGEPVDPEVNCIRARSSSLVSTGSIGPHSSNSAMVNTHRPNSANSGAAGMNGSETTTAFARIMLMMPVVSAAQRARSVRGVNWCSMVRLAPRIQMPCGTT